LSDKEDKDKDKEIKQVKDEEKQKPVVPESDKFMIEELRLEFDREMDRRKLIE
jgi:hypothetical protein